MPVNEPPARETVGPEGVLVYLRTSDDNDALAWIGTDGQSVSESQFAILKAAECQPDTPAMPRLPRHHTLVQQGVQLIVNEERSSGGQLGRPNSARRRVYERLKNYADDVQNTVFEDRELLKVIDELYRYPLYQSTAESLNRRLRVGITDRDLIEFVIGMRADDRLCQVTVDDSHREPHIICSLGLKQP